MKTPNLFAIGSLSFEVDYKKLNSITTFPQYLQTLIDDLITNFPTTKFISFFDLTSRQLHVQVNPDDLVKNAFVSFQGIV